MTEAAPVGGRGAAPASRARSARSGGATGAPRRRSLLGKVVVALSTVTCLVALATVFPLAGVYRRQLVDVRRERLDLATRLLVQKSLADCQTERQDLLEVVERNARALAGELGGADVRVVDHRGIAITLDLSDEASSAAARHLVTEAGTDLAREAGGLARLRGPVSRLVDGHLIHLTPIRSATGLLEGALLLDAPLGTIDTMVSSHVLLRLALLPVFLLVLGAATIFVVYRYVLRPVAVLTVANRAIVQGDVARALVPDAQIPDDEIGDVIRARNRIYETLLRYQDDIRQKNKVLEEQRIELEHWNRELEARVAEKTDELSRAQEHLVQSEKLASTGSLAAGLAHEINNPLASIAGYAEDLRELSQAEALRDLPAFTEFEPSLRIIEEQAWRCKRIIRRLMDFAKPAPYKPEPLALGPLVAEVLPLVEHKARGRRVTILADVAEGLPPVLADRARLEQVLVNLLINAFDAIDTPEGRVAIVARPLGTQEVAIDVADTGPGVPPDLHLRVFDPFFTTKPRGQGTGLGLAISHALITRMGGRLEIAAARGRGATFRIALPRA